MRIKNIYFVRSMAFACLSLVLLSACSNRKDKASQLELPEPDVESQAPAVEEPADKTPPPKANKAPSISGKDWRGYYYRTDKPGRLALTATIKQGKKEVKLTTFNKKDKVHSLVGSLDPDGQLSLEDKAHPSIWTSSFGPVSENTLKIVAPIGSEGTPASQIINLRR